MSKNTKAKNISINSKNNKKTSQKKSGGASGKNFEVFALCLSAFCLYMLVCIYSKGNSGGFIGKLVNGGVTAIMGTCAYILPIMTIAIIIYSLFISKNGDGKKKAVYSYSLLFVVTGLFQAAYAPKLPVGEWFSYGMSGQTCGGFLGAFLLTALDFLAGPSGAYIIMICAVLVFLVLIFNVSFMSMLAWLKDKITSAINNNDSKSKSEPKKRGVAVEPEFYKEESVRESDIVINVPEEEEFEYLEDPEIRIYDDVVSGPEDEEPSEEEKEAKRLSGEETETMTREIQEEIENSGDGNDKFIEYTFPDIDLLARPQANPSAGNVQEELKNNARQLIETLKSFKVDAKVVEISQGPTITRYEIEPAEGIRVSQITNLSRDIGLRFKADKGVMVAPVPGKSTIGIEIENKDPSVVTLREVIESEEFKNHKSKLAVALGKDVSGKPIIMDLAKMPHLLIAGATGAGKSVCINTLIVSLMYKADPNEVKLVMIDPKQVELGVYNGIPHLLIPVVKDAKKATGALSWAVQEMTERYSIFERNNVRNIKGYNDLMEKNGTPENKMASIVIIIDEFADLMMVAPADVENYVCRIAQLARAAGMHLVIATQRPVVKFITGNIKANVPSRISFMVASVKDSQTILDMGGAEKLIGRGDMLYMPVGETSPSRMQCAFVSDDDVKAVVEAVSKDAQAVYDVNVIEQLEKDEGEYQPDGEDPGDADELLPDAIDMAITSGQISTSLLQRRFRIGYNRAGSIIDQMEARGIISGLDGNKPRQVLISREEYNEMLMK